MTEVMNNSCMVFVTSFDCISDGEKNSEGIRIYGVFKAHPIYLILPKSTMVLTSSSPIPHSHAQPGYTHRGTSNSEIFSFMLNGCAWFQN